MKKLFIAAVFIYESAWPFGYHIVRLYDIEGNEIGQFRNYGTKYEYKNTIQSAVNTFMSGFVFINSTNAPINIERQCVIIVNRL